MSTSKHVFHAELLVGNPTGFFPISRLTLQKKPREATYFPGVWTIQFPRQIARCAMGIYGDSMGFCRWPCDSLHPGEKPWTTDATWYGIFQCRLGVPEAYVRLLSCSHQPEMKRWKDRKVKERTSMDSKQQLLTQLLLTQFLGVERLNLERNPG